MRAKYHRPVKFEWDASKAARNLKVHGVSFDDASAVLGDPLAGTIDDPLHSHIERRSVTIGGALGSAAGCLPY